MKIFSVTTLAGLSMVIASAVHAEPIRYPQIQADSTIETLHGVKVADPFRFLEDSKIPTTKKFIEGQRKISDSYFKSILFRNQVFQGVLKSLDFEDLKIPTKIGNTKYFRKLTAKQNHLIFYRSVNEAKPEVILDPNTHPEFQNGWQISRFDYTPDGKKIVMELNQNGSDWGTYRVYDITARKFLFDRIEWVKVSSLAVDNNGFFYSRYPANSLEGKNQNHQVFRHEFGQQQKDDKLIFADQKNPDRFQTVSYLDKERTYLALYSSNLENKLRGNLLSFLDLTSKKSSWEPIIQNSGNSNYNLLAIQDGVVFLETNQDAPFGKVVSYRLDDPNQKWTTIIDPKDHTIDVVYHKNRFIVNHTQDVTNFVTIHDLSGNVIKEFRPKEPMVMAVYKNKDTDSFFITSSNLTTPPQRFEYDIQSLQIKEFVKSKAPFVSEKYITKRVFATSKDGTKIPMFLAYKKGLEQSGNNPALLYSYGGFGSIQSPSFDTTLTYLLQNNFVYALCNTRGGGEYGQNWHLNGSGLKSQNSIDDLNSCAEYLKQNKYTSPNRLASSGSSNGGKLVSMAMIQRPDLYRAVIAGVPVTDMLRFQNFTIGQNWVREYGDIKNKEDFTNLFRLSPYHNVKKTAQYPSVFITTGEFDDRVVPAHSYKFAAQLQQSGTKNPVILMIGDKSGHGGGLRDDNIKKIADEYTFLMQELDAPPVAQ